MYLVNDPQFKKKLQTLAGYGAFDPSDIIFPKSNFSKKKKFYPFYLREPYCVEGKDMFSSIDKDMLEQIRDGSFKLLIVMVTECPDLFETYRWKRKGYLKDIKSTPYYKIESQMIENGIDPKQVLWITSLSDTQKDIKYLKGRGIQIQCRFQHYNFFIPQQQELDRKFLHMTDVKRHFICLGKGTKQHHRYGMIYSLYANDLLEKGYVSCSEYNKFNYQEVTTTTTMPNLSTDQYLKKINEKFLLGFRAALPYNLDNGNNLEHSDMTEYYRNTFLDLVNETHTLNDKVFVTEKTVKAIDYCKPFVINGDRGTLKYLHSMGFKTFNQWWDESYDEDKTDWERINSITKIIKHICSLSEKQIMKLYEEMLPTIKHNFKRLKTFKNESIN